MGRFARFVVRRRAPILVVTVVVVVVTGVLGSGAADRLEKGGFLNPPSSESGRAATLLAERFQAGDPNLVLLVTADDGSVDSGVSARAGAALTEETSRLIGAPATSYWRTGQAALRSTDGRSALLLGTVPGSGSEVAKLVKRIAPMLEQRPGPLGVQVTGKARVDEEFYESAKRDASEAELIAFPALLLLLIVVYRSAVAAVLPLAIAILTASVTFFAMQVIGTFTYVHANLLNLQTILSLGLSVDYSLFIVSRFRDELGAGRDPHAAAVRATQTAGVTVLFSGAAVTVAIAAIGLLPAPLNSFGLICAPAVVAAIAAVVVLPALLATLGHRVDSLRLGRRPRAATTTGFWYRLASGVMRRPVPVAVACIGFLLALGAPFLQVRFSTPDERSLPSGSAPRIALEEIRRSFSAGETSAISIVAPLVEAPAERRADLEKYGAALSTLPGVRRVDSYVGSFSDGELVTPTTPESRQRFTDPGGRGTWLSVVAGADDQPLSKEGTDLARAVRDLDAPFEVLVGGPSADLIDSRHAVASRLPHVLGSIAVVTMVTLFLLFGSVLVPVKAVLLNVLSLTATMGALVWVFQEGHGASLLDVTPVGSVDTFIPLLLLCVAFGLSMDYEVFLLSRIKEEHDLGADNVQSVALGLERTAGIVTSAAAALSVVFVAVLFGDIPANKLFALGIILAVVVDATIVRGLLVPAVMRLAGEANWWAPAPLRRLHDRIGYRHPPDDEGPQPIVVAEVSVAAAEP